MRPSLLDQRCLEILHASTVQDFKRQMVAFVQELGFETVGAMVVTEHSPTLVEFQTLTNAPAEHLDEFHDQEHAQKDPVCRHCSRFSSPIVWDRHTYVDASAQTLWDRQEPYGYRSGLAVAMHLGHGRHFMFGANWRADRCSNVPHFKAIAEDLLRFADHAQAAAFELTLPSKLVPCDPLGLATRELEALGWSIDGMNPWQVADRMLISERHATLLLRRAMHKLGCSTRYESGLRAIKLGLIKCA